MESLRLYLRSLSEISDTSWEILSTTLHMVTFARTTCLLKSGQVCNSLFFISKGYCRAFYDKDGQEVNTSFFFENDIATNLNSYATDQPSAYTIQACEDVTTIQFDKKKLLEVCEQDPQIALLGRKCLQYIAAKEEKHAAIYKLMTAQERYEYIEDLYPHIIQRVSLTHLSSYLGIARETLSRIRSRRM
ncbi:Crp/Fnr family transcriptional regulator [Cytophagaceae bacterium DM2B3-1]|uniref:Crp/Fnr family transcriptional regulator n=1 Tax=Xanthocytophaga flava TaxID=3048013 RepID=A0ABT7CNS7_9BACT|nr:Crp/Fnr family transcriptional regulator [Xanthocytophaga flavus]MDJ1495409.1 Crp/Fnr family transcriptional regulator [Xanthocytophaga flavus]